jgi:hypothetical protein
MPVRIICCLAGVLALMCASPAFAKRAAASDGSVAVCNEAENSWQGEYDMTTTDDPNPPAFLRGLQHAVGNGNGVGLENAAEHSPALALCVQGDENGGGGDTGGGDTGGTGGDTGGTGGGIG